MMLRLLCMMVSFILFLPLGSQADPKVTVCYDYYEIYGSSERELRQQMNQYGIKWSDGKTYDALTRWYVRWNYEYKRNASDCGFSKVTTFVDVKFKFPKWVDKNKASDGLKRKWDAYINKLQLHENGHKNFGVRAAAEIEQAIADMPASETCKKLGNQANSLGRQIIDRYLVMEKEYDRKTKHGMTQGAVFP